LTGRQEKTYTAVIDGGLTAVIHTVIQQQRRREEAFRVLFCPKAKDGKNEKTGDECYEAVGKPI
jgi:hypothetical protein